MRKEQKLITFKLTEYPELQYVAGSIDKTTLKGCFLEIKGCLESKDEYHSKNMFRFKKRMLGTITRFLDDSLFSKKYIITENISNSFQFTGFSFSQFELTLFPKNKMTPSEMTNELNKLVVVFREENVENSPVFNFYKSIKSKKLEWENIKKYIYK